MKNGKQYFKNWCERVGKKSLQKTTKEKGGSYRAGFKGEDPGHFTRWEAWTALEKNTLYLASISNTQRPKSGRQGTTVGLGLCPAPRPGAAPSQSLSRRVLLLLLYALPFPIFLHFLHFVPIALTLEYWGPWKYRKGSFLFKSPFSVQSNSSPRGWYESWGEAQFGSGEFPSGMRVWRETNTHKNRIQESRSIGIATQRGGQWLVESSWDWSSLPQRLTGKECPSAILPNHYSKSPWSRASLFMYSSKWY